MAAVFSVKIKMAASHNQRSNSGLREVQVSPKYLHSNSTSHLWPFSAVAELTDNAYDPDCHATKMWIDYKLINEEFCLEFTDNGAGMTPDKVNKMLGLGFSTKESKDGRDAIGMYGNGFKSGSMRLGKDAMVFTKSRGSSCRGTNNEGNAAEMSTDDTCTVGLLSQTYLSKIQAETVLIPMVTWTNGRILRECDADLKAIIDYNSLFFSEAELLKQFDSISSISGTHIIIYTLAKDSENKSELDFSDPFDIIYTERQYHDIKDQLAPRMTVETPLYRKSLREYLSILYLKPQLHIYLRGKRVKTRCVANSLERKEYDMYQPRGLKLKVKLTLGFVKQKDDKNVSQDYGAMLYARNRLIVAYYKLPEATKGVMVVTEVNHLTPIHNKQDFENNDLYNQLKNQLRQKSKDYTREKTSADCEIQPERWTWAQCEQCDKWRRLQGVEDDREVPDRWICHMNTDPTYNRCDAVEEKEDKEEYKIARKYTPKRRSRKRKEGERSDSTKKHKLSHLSEDSSDMLGYISSTDDQLLSPMQAHPPKLAVSSDIGLHQPVMTSDVKPDIGQPQQAVTSDVKPDVGQPPCSSNHNTTQIQPSAIQAQAMPSYSLQGAAQPIPSGTTRGATQPKTPCTSRGTHSTPNIIPTSLINQAVRDVFAESKGSGQPVTGVPASQASAGQLSPVLSQRRTNLLNSTQLERFRNISKNMVSPAVPMLSPQISQRMQHLEDKCSAFQQDVDKLTNEMKEKDNLMNEIERVKQNQMDALKMQDKKIQELEDRLTESKAKYLQNEQSVFDLQERKTTLDTLCQQKDNDISELQERLQEANTRCQVNKKTLSEMQKSLKEANSACKVNDTAMADLKAHCQQKDAVVDDMKARCKNKDGVVEDMRKRLSQANTRANQAEEENKELQEIVILTKTKLESVTSECLDKDKNLATLQAKLGLQQNLTEAEKQKLCQEKDRNITELQKKIEFQEKQRSIEVKEANSRLVQAIKEANELKQKCQQYEMSAKKHDEERKDLQNSVKEAIQNCERLQEDLKASRRLCEERLDQIGDLEKICSVAEALRLQIRSLLHMMLPDLDLPQLIDVDQAVCEMVQAYERERDGQSAANNV